MKKFNVHVKRTYNVYLDVEVNSKEELDKILSDAEHPNNTEIWEAIYHLELEECDVDPIDWEIRELKENSDNTEHGPVFPDWTLHTKYDKNGK